MRDENDARCAASALTISALSRIAPRTAALPAGPDARMPRVRAENCLVSMRIDAPALAAISQPPLGLSLHQALGEQDRRHEVDPPEIPYFLRAPLEDVGDFPEVSPLQLVGVSVVSGVWVSPVGFP